MQPNNHPVSMPRRVLGNVLVFVGGIVLIGSAAAKFAHVPKVVNELGAMGFAGKRLLLIAVLELLSAVLFLVRPTRAAGLLLISAYLGGAVATHIQHGQSPAQPGFILSVLWFGAWLRHPEILWSLRHGMVDSRQLASREHEKHAPGLI